MAQNAVVYSRDGGVAIIGLNRPDRLNAITVDLLEALNGYLAKAREDIRVRSVILTGVGRAFCAGDDLKETKAGKSNDYWVREVDLLQDVYRESRALGKPLIAAVQGYAVGGGCEFAMACDIRIAAQNAVFGLPETSLGFTITTAGTKLLPQIVGLGKAKELILTGDLIDAAEAFRIGLVNRIVPIEDLMGEAVSMGNKLGDHPPLAVKLSRASVEDGSSSTFESVLETERTNFLRCVEEGAFEANVQKRIANMGRCDN